MNEKASEETVKAVLFNQANVMKQAYRDYYNNPYNPHTVHQLRVSMRTMRALLNFLKPVLEEPEYIDLNQRIREAANHLGPLRELDVLIEECSNLALKKPDLTEFYPALFKLLEMERRKLNRSGTAKRSYKVLEKAVNIEDTLNNLILNLEKTGKSSWERFIRNRFDTKMRNLKKTYQKTDHSDYEASHEVRKQAKKVRYATGGFQGWLPKQERKAAEKKAKDIQAELGIISDLHINTQLLIEYSEKTEEETVKEAFLTLARYQEEKRIELTE